MKTRMLTVATVGVAAALLAVVPAGAGRMLDKDACKNGGYVNWTTVPNGAPFKNQGQCVAFVSGGGTLVPVGGEL